MALPFVRIMPGHSDGKNDVASVVTPRVVSNFPQYCPDALSMRLPSSRLEYGLVSVKLLDAIECLVVESAIGMCAGSFILEHNRDRGGGARIGGTSSWSLVVPVGV